MDEDRWLCTCCGQITYTPILVHVPDVVIHEVNMEPDSMWHVCPECGTPEQFTTPCWKCEVESSMGCPTVEHGYVRSCWKHKPKEWDDPALMERAHTLAKAKREKGQELD